MANKLPLVIDAATLVVQQLQSSDLISPSALGTGSASSSTFLRGDGTWQTAAVSGLTIVSGKTLTVNNTLTLAGTDSTTMTFPTTSASIARTDAAQTFTGTQTFAGISVGSGLAAATITSSGIQLNSTYRAITFTNGGGGLPSWINFNADAASASGSPTFTTISNGAIITFDKSVLDGTHATTTIGYGGVSTHTLWFGVPQATSAYGFTWYGGTTAIATLDGTGALSLAAGLSVAAALDLSGASAGQIKFPATQNASTDANTLDDYVEGTWTPTLTPATGAFTTVAVSGATYTKVGNRVKVRLQIVITTNGTAAQNIQFTLPFNPAEDTPFMAFETDITGFVGGGFFNATTHKGVLVKYDGTYLGGNSYRIDVAGEYRV